MTGPADVLADHGRWFSFETYDKCWCGAVFAKGQHPAHQVDAMAAAGYVWIQLPARNIAHGWAVEDTDVEIRSHDHRGAAAVSLVVPTIRGTTLQKSYHPSAGPELAGAIMAAHLEAAAAAETYG